MALSTWWQQAKRYNQVPQIRICFKETFLSRNIQLRFGHILILNWNGPNAVQAHKKKN